MAEKRAIISGNKQTQQLKDLIARGKEQGYLTYAEVNDHLPSGIVDPEQIEDIVKVIWSTIVDVPIHRESGGTANDDSTVTGIVNIEGAWRGAVAAGPFGDE